jgi:NADPH:quinone reductase-like Zn-dependent oxidoreductase
MKAVVIPKFGLDQLQLVQQSDPQLGPGQVLVRVRAVSLNYRDLMVVKGQYNPKMPLPRVPCSDAAGEVLAVGDNVVSVKVGDRVCGTFFQDWEDGPISDATGKSALGGALDGVLAEHVLFRERGVVAMPTGWSFEEAATLPCAAVTAWNALTTNFAPQGKSVLVQGTGGVSLFALQFAKALGARVLITSSSDEKLARAKALGADDGVNYATTPDWEAWARQATNGIGVDLVVEVGGAGTLDRSVKAVRTGGQIALIGVLAGGSSFNPLAMMMKSVTLRGIFVGSRHMFREMNRLLETENLRPVVDRVFAPTEFREAFLYLEQAKHFGKVVIRL